LGPGEAEVREYRGEGMLSKSLSRLGKLRIALEGLLLLILVAILAGRIALAPKRLRAIAARIVRNRMGAELFVEDVRFNFPNSISVVNAYLVTREERGISALMSAREVKYTFGFRGLPWRGLQVEEVSLQQPRVFLERDEDRNWSLSPVQRKWRETRRPGVPSRLIAFRVAGGAIEIVDRSFRGGITRARLKDLRLRPIGPSEADISGYDFEAECVERTLCSLRARIDVDLEKQETVIDTEFGVDLADITGWLPENARSVWSKFSPRGPCAGSFSLHFGPAERGLPDFSGRFELNGCSIGYRPLPYNLSDVRGTVRANRTSAVFEELHGNAGPGDVEITGNLSWADPNALEYTLNIDAEKLLIDERMRGSLPLVSQRVWDELNVRGGEADVTLRLSGVAGTMPDYSGEAEFRRLAVKHSKFPLPVEDLSGTMNFSKGFIEGKEFIGRAAGDTRNEIGANFVGKGSSEGFSLELDVAAQNLPVNENLRQAIGASGDITWAMLSPEGRVTGEFGITLPAGSGQPMVNCTLDLSQVSVSLDRFPYRFDGIRSEARYAGDKITFERMSHEGEDEERSDASLVVEGEVGGLGASRSYDLRVEMDTVPLDEKLHAALPPNAREWWAKLKPSGAVDAAAGVVGEGTDAPTSAELEVELHDCTVTPFGFEVENLDGNVTYEDKRVRIEHLRGSLGTIEFEARGNVSEENGVWPWRFGFETNKFEVGPELSIALPESYAETVARYVDSGDVALSGSAGGRRSVEQIEVRGTLDNVSMPGRLNVKGVMGEMFLAADITEAGLDIAGRADLASMEMAGWQLSGIDAPFDWTDATTVFRDIRATAYGGDIGGDLEISRAENELDVQLQVSSLDLENLVSNRNLPVGKAKGLVDIDLKLSADLDGDQISGQGVARIKDGYLWEIPLFTALLKILPLRLHALTTFSEGLIEYKLDTDKVVIETMELTSTVLSIDGSGSVGYDRSLDLTVGMRPTTKDLHILVVEEVLDEFLKLFAMLQNKVIRFNVKGSFSEPAVSLDPTALPKEVFSKVAEFFKKVKPRRREGE